MSLAFNLQIFLESFGCDIHQNLCLMSIFFVLWLEAQKRHVLLSKGTVGHNNRVGSHGG
jgi:hypothetical protein